MGGEISARHDILVNILLSNILKQRGLTTREQKWEERNTVRTARDEITVGTEHPQSDEWKGKGRVAGARLKPDLVWLRRDSVVEWRKVVVVVVKVASTEDLNKAFKEKMTNTECWRPVRPERRMSQRL